MIGISIIIPMYNAENTIARCLDSVLSNNIENIEIICVNDGSSDRTSEVVKFYESCNSNIRLIEKENEGPFKARKLGIEVATKEYIGFIDSDDWIEDTYFDDLRLAIAETNSDIIMFNYINDYLDSPSVISKVEIDEKIYLKESLKKEIYPLLMKDGCVNGMCNKIYKSHLCKDNNILYNHNYGEDLIYQLDIFDKAESFFILNKNLYHYVHENIKSLSNSKQNFQLLLDMFLIRKKYASKWNIKSEFVFEPFTNLVCMCFLSSIKKLDILEIKKILNNKNAKEAFLGTHKINTVSKKIKIIFKLLKIIYQL